MGPISRVSLATPRHTLASMGPDDFDEVSIHSPADTRDSISSARPTLPSFRGHVPVSSVPILRQSSVPVQPKIVAPAAYVRTTAPRVRLVAVETVEEQGSDDWELEFLRRSQCS
jgi:hypothetical protein